MQPNKPIVFFDIDYTLFDTDFFKKSKLSKHQVYEEVIGVLGSLKKIAILGIFSEGDLEFQLRKLFKTDIKKYFEQIHMYIVLNKLDEIKKVFEKYSSNKIFLVDDKLTILYDLKNFMPAVFAIWVKRGRYAQNQKEIPGFKPDATITDLKEVIGLVRFRLWPPKGLTVFAAPSY